MEGWRMGLMLLWCERVMPNCLIQAMSMASYRIHRRCGAARRGWDRCLESEQLMSLQVKPAWNEASAATTTQLAFMPLRKREAQSLRVTCELDKAKMVEHLLRNRESTRFIQIWAEKTCLREMWASTKHLRNQMIVTLPPICWPRQRLTCIRHRQENLRLHEKAQSTRASISSLMHHRTEPQLKAWQSSLLLNTEEQMALNLWPWQMTSRGEMEAHKFHRHIIHRLWNLIRCEVAFKSHN